MHPPRSRRNGYSRDGARTNASHFYQNSSTLQKTGNRSRLRVISNDFVHFSPPPPPPPRVLFPRCHTQVAIGIPAGRNPFNFPPTTTIGYTRQVVRRRDPSFHDLVSLRPLISRRLDRCAVTPPPSQLYPEQVLLARDREVVEVVWLVSGY